MEPDVASIYFKPNGQPPDFKELGLMARCALQEAVFENFREPVTLEEIQICQNTQFKMYLHGDRPFLWILTSSIAPDVLEMLGAIEDAENWETGVYFLPKISHMGIIAINALPRTHETLWFRVMGKGVTQEEAIDDVIALPKDNFHRSSVLKLLLTYKTDLEGEAELDEEEQRLVAKLSVLFPNQ